MSNISKLTLRNAAVELTMDAFGGAITHFTFRGFAINPLSFSFPADQMPENNRGGAVYQGHFACIGRWGEASAAEKKLSIPNHGAPANSLWQVDSANDDSIHMQVMAAKEGLRVTRLCTMDERSPVFFDEGNGVQYKSNRKAVQHGPASDTCCSIFRWTYPH